MGYHGNEGQEKVQQCRLLDQLTEMTVNTSYRNGIVKKKIIFGDSFCKYTNQIFSVIKLKCILVTSDCRNKTKIELQHCINVLFFLQLSSFSIIGITGTGSEIIVWM